MTKFSVIFLDEKPIVEYLRIYGHGSNSKDYELAISVWVKRLFEKNKNSPHCIAFELKQELLKYKPDFSSENPEHIKDVIENLRLENTPIDFLLVEGSASSHSATGWGFQLKRFGKKIRADFVHELTKYTNGVLAKNRPGEVGLIIIPEITESLEIREAEKLKRIFSASAIGHKLQTQEESYKKVLILGRDKESISLTEIWPSAMSISMPCVMV